MSEHERSFAFAATREGRLPVGFQVLAVIGVLFAVLAASIVVAVLSLVSLSEDQAELQDKNVPYAVAIATAALNAKGMANDERGYLISGNREFLEELEQRLLNVRTAFAEAVISADGERQREAVRKAHAGFEEWVWALRAQFRTFQAGRREAATDAALGRGRALRKDYEASLEEAESVATTALQLRHNPFASRGWLVILLLSLLAMLVICVGLTLWLVRTLRLANDVESVEPVPDPAALSEASLRALRRERG
jgi:CHASE3 domain sensor protein